MIVNDGAVEHAADVETPPITWGLVLDVLGILEDHGYHAPTGPDGNQACGAALLAVGDLIKAYTGRHS